MIYGDMKGNAYARTQKIWVLVLLCLGIFAMSAAQAGTQFADYPIKEYAGKHKVDFSGKTERMFKTTLVEASKSKIEFAGEYVLTGWGCGTGCAVDAMLNVRTGKVYVLDFGQVTPNVVCANMNEQDGQIITHPNSRLMAVVGAYYNDSAADSSEPEQCSTYYYLENKGKLVPIKP